MAADPTLTAALALDNVTVFGSLKAEFPSATLRLLDGAGRVDVGGEIYTGMDSTYGVLDAVDVITEDDSDEQPEISISLSPPDASAATTLANSAMQGSKVTISVGAIDTASGLPIGTPEVKFLGEIDVPTLTTNAEGRRVDYTVLSVFERLFELDEGVRASDGWHQSVWPGELGLEFMTGTQKNLYWGGKKPSGQTAQFTGGGSRRALDNLNFQSFQ